MTARQNCRACELATALKTQQRPVSGKETLFSDYATKLCSSANDPFLFRPVLLFYTLIMFLPKHFHIDIPKYDINYITYTNYNPACIISCLSKTII